jgi:flagellar biogenesis protein FliO
MNALQWIASTIAVLTLILLIGRAARWLLARSGFESGACGQMAQWRVAPDASVRAIRVFDEVHLVLETRRHAAPLTTLAVEEFEAKQERHTPPSEGWSRFLPGLDPRAARARAACSD